MVLSTSQAMRVYTFVLVLAILAVTYSSAIPKPDGEKKERTKEKHLSDKDHDDHGEHNNDYDHDAFLGKEEAQSFDELTPEQSKERLAIIVDKIDKDTDGFVTEAELIDWIKYVQMRYVLSDTNRMWADHEPDSDNKLLWQSYMKRTYGYDNSPDEADSPVADYKDMINRDRRRWDKADKDSDGKLSKEEFQDFLHPEDAEHMKDVVVDETLEDIDKDKDGFISVDEYIADIWDEDSDDDDDDDDDDHHNGEPDWVASEREQFVSYRDKNKDGKLDKDEIKEWIIPEDYDHSAAETRHLMDNCDANKDEKLSKEEILEKYDLFVGSQATDFGEALTRHDEF